MSMASRQGEKSEGPLWEGAVSRDVADDFLREIKITHPFDMKPMIDGAASVLDEELQDEICRFVTGTVRLASRKFVNLLCGKETCHE